MSLPGIGSHMMGKNSTSYAATLTVGSSTVVIGYDPKGGGDITSTARGMAISDATYGTFGSLDVANYQGFPIVGLYQKDSDGTTYLVLSGNASGLSPVLKVNTVNQNLGAGSYSGGKTTFSGTATDPFVGHATRDITITP